MVGTALGVGGFGITYRAWDNTLQKMLAIKEYYPSANGIVNRVPGKPQVIVYSGNRAVEFENGKVRFPGGGQKHGQVQHPPQHRPCVRFL